MVDAVKDEEGGHGGLPTPPLADANTFAPDKTVQLDRVIAERNPSVPERFGRYEVIARIGIGGFASVFSARDPDLEAPVAIKVLAENHSADVEVRKRFVAEARVARRLGGDRLIGVFDLGETDDGRPYVVMELATGGTLRARLNRIGRPSKGSLLRLIDELGDCMDAVHSKGVIHRDIKPSNLLLRTSGPPPDHKPTELIEEHERLVLADFGLARDISGGASAMTVGGGTAGYMAPEQADPNGKADVRADLYAATVVLAELTTGRHPERLDLATANLSEPVRKALARGMSLDREDRPSTASEWRDELRKAYAHAHAAPKPTAPEPEAIEPNSELTRPLDATQVQAPHQFRAMADAEYDESGLLDPGLAEDSSDPADELDRDGVVVDSTAATRPLAALDDASDEDGAHTAILPDDLRPSGKPRTFVRPVIDEEPPPPPPSIPLSPRAQRPAPGYGSDEPVNAAAAEARRASRPEQKQVAPATVPIPDTVGAPPQHATIPVPQAGGHTSTSRPSPAATAAPPPPTAPPPPAADAGRNAAPHRQPAVPPTQSAPQQPTPHQPVQQQPVMQQPAPALPAQQQPAQPWPAGPAQQPTPQQPARRQPVSRQPAGPIPGLPAPPAGAGQPVGPGLQRVAQSQPPGPASQGPVRAPSRPGSAPVTKAQIKQQQRLIRQTERRRRWRRRRRRFSNLIRALIRGVLAFLVMSVIAAILVSSRTGADINDLTDNGQAVVNGVGIVSFFLGLRLFPWPRRLDPHG